MIIEAAKCACMDYATVLERPLEIGQEKFGRIDVHAEDLQHRNLVVAFESELAYWDYNGSSGKDWREEFRKLCSVSSELRVLSSTFKAGSGRAFRQFLIDRLSSMQDCFHHGSSGPFCLIFGPEDTRKDPMQPWLAFALEADMSLRDLSSGVPLRPRQVIERRESASE